MKFLSTSKVLWEVVLGWSLSFPKQPVWLQDGGREVLAEMMWLQGADGEEKPLLKPMLTSWASQLACLYVTRPAYTFI